MPNYKNKTDIWLLHEYLWVDVYGDREGNDAVKKELGKRGYLFSPEGHIIGYRFSGREVMHNGS